MLQHIGSGASTGWRSVRTWLETVMQYCVQHFVPAYLNTITSVTVAGGGEGEPQSVHQVPVSPLHTACICVRSAESVHVTGGGLPVAVCSLMLCSSHKSTL